MNDYLQKRFNSYTRIIVGCEYSQVIMSAFFKAGFDAWSCDLLPCEGEFPERHIQGDILKVLNEQRFDLGIFHPPCQFISWSGSGHWNDKGRVFKRLKALEFFAQLWESDIKHICIENPVGCANVVIANYHQVIHPYFFGEPHMKKTCLWLKNLPKLQHIQTTDLFELKTHTEKPQPIYVDKSGQKRYFTDSISGIKNGGHLRSKSFSGIANAMVQQWGNYISQVYELG